MKTWLKSGTDEGVGNRNIKVLLECYPVKLCASKFKGHTPQVSVNPHINLFYKNPPVWDWSRLIRA